MRISDWSSDVCSSDLQDAILVDRLDARERRLDLVRQRLGALCVARLGIVQRAETLDQLRGQFGRVAQRRDDGVHAIRGTALAQIARSEERRVGKASVSTCRYRGSPYL